MPQYSKTSWVDGTAPAISAANLNKLEQGVFDSIRQDGSTTMSAQFVTTAGSAATPAIAPTGDANTGIFFPAADTIAFAEGGTEVMRINSSGQVGIGIDPTNKLHLYQNNTNQQYISISNATSTFLVGQDSSGNMVNYTNQAVNYQWSNSGTPRLTITSTGNVGIGTTSPTRALEISSATNTYQRLTSTIDASCFLEFNTNGVARANLTGDGNGLALKVLTSADMYFHTNNQERMRISSNGNVGIGVNPNVELHVKGTGEILRIETTAATGDNYIRFYAPSGTTQSFLGYSSAANNHFAINNVLNADVIVSTNNAERMRITSTGSVGIGDFASNPPPAQLSVSSSTGGVVGVTTKRASGTNASPLSMSYGFYGYLDGEKARITATERSGNTNASDLNFQVKDSSDVLQSRLYISTAGNVGIGTSSPGCELHLKSAGEIMRLETTTARGSGGNYLQFNDPTGIKAYFGYTGSNDNININNTLTGSISFSTDAISRLIIQSTGNTIPAANNTYDLGSSSFRWATIYAQNALNTSDARLKTDVAPSSLGLDFIAALNPVQYKWIEGGNTVERVQTGTETVEITPAIPAQTEQEEILDEEGNVIQEYVPATEEVPAVTEERPVYEEVVTPREGVRTHFGLIAQEVKSALPDGLDFAGWCLADKDDADSTQSLGYTQLIAPMIKAIQELNAKVEALEAQLAK